MASTETTTIETLLQMQFEDAPAEMQALLKSASFQNTVLGIGDLYELDENAKNELFNEVTLICLGLSSVEELAIHLRPIVNDQEKADEIAVQVFETVLYENLGLVPTSLTPRAEEVFATLETTEEEDAGVSAEVVQTPAPSIPPPVTPVSTAPEPESETSTVPRYARPLTDIPRYGNQENQ